MDAIAQMEGGVDEKRRRHSQRAHLYAQHEKTPIHNPLVTLS